MINLKMCTLHLIGLNLKEKGTKKLVNELKQRRSNGEQNLAIRNGSIVVINRRSQPTGPVSDQSAKRS